MLFLLLVLLFSIILLSFLAIYETRSDGVATIDILLLLINIISLALLPILFLEALPSWPPALLSCFIFALAVWSTIFALLGAWGRLEFILPRRFR